MAKWQVVSKEKHAKSGWLSPTNYEQAKSTGLAPLTAAEVSHALPFYPLAFAKLSDDQFQLCAIFSLKNGENLFLNKDNRWLVPYVPAALRSYPFSMMETSSGSHVLAVDVESAFFKDAATAKDNRILTEQGEADESLSQLLDFMRQRMAQQQTTDKAVQLLIDHSLLEPWTVKVHSDNGELLEQQLPGLYRANEESLKALTPDTLSYLMQSGALGLAYSQVFSQPRLKDLQARFNIKQQQQQQQNANLDQIDFDKMFDGDSEDIFSF